MQLSLLPDPDPLVARVHARLLSSFGAFSDSPRAPPLDQLANSLISSRTHDEVSWAAFVRLKARYRTWERLLRAPVKEIEATISTVAYAEDKAKWLPQALARIVAHAGRLSLDFLADEPVETAHGWLRTLPGVGDKVAAAVLNFSTLKRPIMVVDTHVWRVGRRIGLAARNVEPEAVRKAIMAAVPAEWSADAFFDLHWLLKRLGQTFCQHDQTRCGTCPLVDLCASSHGGRGRGPAPVPEQSVKPSPLDARRALKAQLKLMSGGEARVAAPSDAVSLGWPEIDAAFSVGGLAAGVHQAAGTRAAPLGFGAAVMIRALAREPARRGLVVQTRSALVENGRLYPPGLQALGLDPDRLAVAEARDEAEALRVVDEALRSRAVAAVLADLGDAQRLDLTATRRFNLSAEGAKALALIVSRDLAGTSAALTRWRVTAAPSRTVHQRLGRPTFQLHLVRNRLGPVGEWNLEWDRDEQAFRPLSLPVGLVRPIVDRPRAPTRSEPRLAPGPRRQAG
jgi:endonuclease-3